MKYFSNYKAWKLQQVHTNEFSAKMKIRETISNDLHLNKCYSGHDLERHSKGFSRRSDTLRNAKASGIVIFKPYNSKTLWKIILL